MPEITEEEIENVITQIKRNKFAVKITWMLLGRIDGNQIDHVLIANK